MSADDVSSRKRAPGNKPGACKKRIKHRLLLDRAQKSAAREGKMSWRGISFAIAVVVGYGRIGGLAVDWAGAPLIAHWQSSLVR